MGMCGHGDVEGWQQLRTALARRGKFVANSLEIFGLGWIGLNDKGATGFERSTGPSEEVLQRPINGIPWA
jgi:hypothetical protein